MLTYDNINDSFLGIIQRLLNSANVNVTHPRNFDCYEFKEPQIIEIKNPLKRCLLLQGRKNNPFATMFETLWVLSGRNDMESLKLYLPNCMDYSDNGQVWRAGYGPRIASGKYVDYRGINQIEYVYDCLKKDKDSRRAVIGIWNPAEEIYANYTGGSKDFPCCNVVQFMIRNNKLNCYVYIRSNDVLWGYSHINVFEWTFLQSLLANCLNVEVGSYYHISPSLHFYEDQKDRLLDIYNKNFVEFLGLYNDINVKDVWENKDLLHNLSKIGEVCDYATMVGYPDKLGFMTPMPSVIEGGLLNDAVSMFFAWGFFIRDDFDNAMVNVLAIKKYDLKLACFYYLCRKNREWFNLFVTEGYLYETFIKDNSIEPITTGYGVDNYLKTLYSFLKG